MHAIYENNLNATLSRKRQDYVKGEYRTTLQKNKHYLRREMTWKKWGIIIL